MSFEIEIEAGLFAEVKRYKECKQHYRISLKDALLKIQIEKKGNQRSSAPQLLNFQGTAELLKLRN